MNRIQKPNDIKKIPRDKLGELAKEIRDFLIEKVSINGGHLASNLGVVELTMALHLLLDFPRDRIIWDVGHQCYVHKILTGRAKGFDSLRQFGGMAGFPKREESVTDLFTSGHSSNSISEACGLVKARELRGTNEKIVAVIGDGALTGGLAFEGLNNAGRLNSNMLIVLNDNNMSISENVGGMASYLGNIRTAKTYNAMKWDISKALEQTPVIGSGLVRHIRKSKNVLKQLMIPGMLFEEMGITYIGPIDGHNLKQMYTAFRAGFQKNGAVLVHVVTQKGKGYDCAENNPSVFHGVDAFDIETGQSLKDKGNKTYTQVFSDSLMEIGGKNKNVVAITAAMPIGTGLDAFAKKYPDRCVDVGIAEEHAVSYAAGLAAGGFHPVVAVYSTFLQRAYDQILHDICLNRFPVTFAIDRAGIVGNDGPTHQGLFDLSYLSHIPNLEVMAPKNAVELKDMLEYATNADYPTAVRYPRGNAFFGLTKYREPVVSGKAEWLKKAGDIVFLAVGSMVETAWEVSQLLEEKKIPCSVVNVRFVSPVDEAMLKEAESYNTVVVLEENVGRGGLGEHAAKQFAMDKRCGNYLSVAFPDCFIEHGNTEQLKDKYGFTAQKIMEMLVEKGFIS